MNDASSEQTTVKEVIVYRELKNIVYNPETGMFEDSTDPTIHITSGKVQKRRNRQSSNPMTVQMKPIFTSIYLTGGEHPLEEATVEMTWCVQKAQRVVVTFPSGNNMEFQPSTGCQFVVPKHDCFVRLVAHNGKYTTQRTIQIKPKRRSVFLNLLQWIGNG